MSEDSRSEARAIIDGNLYMVLATVGADGAPWASPVFYSTEDGRDLYWVSSPEVTHSRNIAHEPRIGIVLHDSRARWARRAPSPCT
ncbi:pyridoxamine 5'-phosphate oxidase family protein [Streptomyces coeruleorubidus]|uniref:pyridoxamine 5'-phosphate oxidase family protein n=1 Tax=Streptomyces coeruleorubidus TaxID=116188 RepID=UPI00237F9CA1|nr:pyridoxamine 5'-phosphate oxidase family protein [Streptomyces coeruleorubidus]WDV49778.1 pyridoxamine 5'-phosphate oxidase family protein [Streptomyces coeruleorubidus]